MNKLSNQPPKGTSDWLPEEFLVRKYIFDTWRKVCTSFGYEEYLTPIVESAEIYRAKSGEDVGGKELMSFFDRGERELAIRPEMTPSVTRMVTKIYDAQPKPLRLFSIANFFRNEKPQRGRNREFWQLNFDVFGSESINADAEILQMAVEIMLSFGADRTMYKVSVNNKKILEEIIMNYLGVPKNNLVGAVRVLDKYGKIPNEELQKRLTDLGANPYEWEFLFGLMEQNESSLSLIKSNYLSKESLDSMNQLLSKVNLQSNAEIEWKPSLARGFDYYDGMVFEVFDKNPENSRAMFGGGRYNGLASIFGSKSFPAVGCAPGDETTKLFLEAWNLVPKDLIPEKYFLPLLSNKLTDQISKLGAKLRREGKNVIMGFEEQRVGKALEFADKNKIKFVVILGENEFEKEVYKLKNMVSGEEVEINL